MVGYALRSIMPLRSSFRKVSVSTFCFVSGNAFWISLNRLVSSSSTLTIRVAYLQLRISRTSCVWSFFITFISCLLFQFLVLLIAPLLLDYVVFPNLPIGHLESAES